VSFNGFKVSKEDKIKEEGKGNMALAFAFAFLLYLSLIMTGTMTMSSVIEEKTSKVVEVLLSSVSSRELMGGKMVGSTVTALAQMIIWLLPLIFFIGASWITLPFPLPFSFDISIGYLIYFLFNFALGMLIFQGLFVMVGAIFNDPQEAQQGVFPVMFLIIIPFLLCFSLINNPDNRIGVIASYVPFATILVMPVRYTLVDMSFIYPLLSCLVNIATLAVISPIAGKIYRVGILRTGTKPTWKEVMTWIKVKD
jgi:ABC-2 type transport system permease protein